MGEGEALEEAGAEALDAVEVGGEDMILPLIPITTLYPNTDPHQGMVVPIKSLHRKRRRPTSRRWSNPLKTN